MITRQTIKQMAKADWRRDRRAIFKAAALLLILSLILTLLVSFLSERFTLMMVNISNELNSKPEMLLNPTEEFANEVFNELSAAFSTDETTHRAPTQGINLPALYTFPLFVVWTSDRKAAWPEYRTDRIR